MLYLIYALVIVVATSLGAVAGLGGGVIIKPLLDLVGYHDAATINLYSSVAVFVMCCVSLSKQLRAGFEFDRKMVLSVAIGSILGGVAGDKVFSALTGSFDSHLVKAVQAGVLAVVLGAIFVYTIKQDQMPSWHLTDPASIFAAGFALGALAVFLGIGGGPLNVAVLTLARVLPRASTPWPSSSSASSQSWCCRRQAVRFGPLTSRLFRLWPSLPSRVASSARTSTASCPSRACAASTCS